MGEEEKGHVHISQQKHLTWSQLQKIHLVPHQKQTWFKCFIHEAFASQKILLIRSPFIAKKQVCQEKAFNLEENLFLALKYIKILSSSQVKYNSFSFYTPFLYLALSQSKAQDVTSWKNPS